MSVCGKVVDVRYRRAAHADLALIGQQTKVVLNSILLATGENLTHHF